MENSVIERIEQAMHKGEDGELKMIALQVLDALVTELHEAKNPLYLYGGSRIKRTAIYCRDTDISFLRSKISEHLATIADLRATVSVKVNECVELERIIREMTEAK